MKTMGKWMVGMLAGAMLSGCASQSQQAANPVDPWEGFNRRVYAFNDVIDRYALKPVAQGYDFITPEPVQTGVGNFFSNLGEIGTTINSVLQWKWANAGVSSGRFLVNSTLGVAGLLDPATQMGLTVNKEDFGQTLAVWGVDAGPYVVLPLLGGRTLRHAGAIPADIYTDPVTYVEDDTTRWGLRILELVDLRAGLLDQEKLIRGDRYIFLRDAYLQRRQFMISDGETGADPFASGEFDFDIDDGDFAE